MFSKDGVRLPSSLHALGLNLETLHKKQNNLRYLHESRNHWIRGDDQGIALDIIPILTKQEWNEVETGIAQRLKALNLFF
jgi:uncharacterized circularly permuted ATP-grasp superfamily protein